MKRIIIAIILLLTYTSMAFGAEGEMGHTGGVSEGSNLPKTIEKYIEIPSSTTNTYQYKEIVFISGKPIEFEGTIEVTLNDSDILENPIGTYNESYTIEASNAENAGTLIEN